MLTKKFKYYLNWFGILPKCDDPCRKQIIRLRKFTIVCQYQHKISIFLLTDLCIICHMYFANSTYWLFSYVRYTHWILYVTWLHYFINQINQLKIFDADVKGVLFMSSKKINNQKWGICSNSKYFSIVDSRGFRKFA